MKKHYIKSKDIPDTDCEYYAVGDITRTGYISCKIHGNYQNRKPVPDKPEVIITHGKMPKWLGKKSNNQNKTPIPPQAYDKNGSPLPPPQPKIFYHESLEQK